MKFRLDQEKEESKDEVGFAENQESFKTTVREREKKSGFHDFECRSLFILRRGSMPDVSVLCKKKENIVSAMSAGVFRRCKPHCRCSQ